MFGGVVLLWMVLAGNPADFTVFVVGSLLLHSHLCAQVLLVLLCLVSTVYSFSK